MDGTTVGVADRIWKDLGKFMDEGWCTWQVFKFKVSNHLSDLADHQSWCPTTTSTTTVRSPTADGFPFMNADLPGIFF